MALINRKFRSMGKTIKSGGSSACILPEIGVDLVEIARFELDQIKDKRFLEKIFCQNELDYCFGRPKPSQHLAARFAAKEAAIKALSACGIKVSGWKILEVINDKSGRPVLLLPKGLNKISKISLSHDDISAIAMVIIFSQ